MNNSTQQSRTKKFSIHALVIFLLASGFIFYKYALEMAPDVLNLTWQHDLGLTSGQIGNIAASYYYSYMLLQIPIGLIVDYWGVKRISMLGILCCVIGSLLLSIAHGFWMAELGRFVTGFGAAGAFICGVKLITVWFKQRHFAVLVGLFIMLGILGGVGGHEPLASLINSLGWRASLRWAAALGVVLIVLYQIFLRDKKHASETEYNSAVKSLSSGLKHISKSTASWWVSMYSGLMFAPLVVLGGVFGIATLRGLYKISIAHATVSSQALFVGFALAAPISGWISDKMRARMPLMIVGPILAMLILAALFLQVWPAQYLPYALFLFGLFLGGFLPCFAMIKELNPLIYAGCAVGFMNTFESAFSGFSATAAGHLFQWLQHWAWVRTIGAHKLIIVFLLVEMLVAMLFLLRVRETHCQQAAD